jgi:hypothetical protein
LTGILLGERGHFLLKRAQNDYTLSMMTVPNHIIPLDDMLRLLLAAQNNQVVIYMEFGMRERSRACLEVLEKVLMAMPPRTLQEQRLDFDHEVLLNLMILSRQEVAGAA